MSHEHLLREPGIVRLTLNLVHSLVELLNRYSKSLAESHSVKAASLLILHDHYVIGWLVIHHQLAFPVCNDTTRWELYSFQKGIGVCALSVIIAHNLKGE